ncbi:S4 domain-containing protein [Novosphingobium panipatense]
MSKPPSRSGGSGRDGFSRGGPRGGKGASGGGAPRGGRGERGAFGSASRDGGPRREDSERSRAGRGEGGGRGSRGPARREAPVSAAGTIFATSCPGVVRATAAPVTALGPPGRAIRMSAMLAGHRAAARPLTPKRLAAVRAGMHGAAAPTAIAAKDGAARRFRITVERGRSSAPNVARAPGRIRPRQFARRPAARWIPGWLAGRRARRPSSAQPPRTCPRAAGPTPKDPSLPAREGERIAKLLARAGIASRREVERMIAEGRVKLGETVIDTPATVLTSLQGITVDGTPSATRKARASSCSTSPAALSPPSAILPGARRSTPRCAMPCRRALAA